MFSFNKQTKKPVFTQVHNIANKNVKKEVDKDIEEKKLN
jgi:hypothetical protein